MLHRILLIGALLGAATLSIGHAADLTEGMKKGTPDLKSAGPATFAPQGILLLGDSQGATVFAIATGDTASGSPAQPLNIERIDEQIAALLGTSPKEITINDLAVNPETGNAFLTVSRGTGPAAKPVIIRVDASGKLGEFSLADKLFSLASIPNAAQDKGRQEVTTDLQFVDGQVIVAGLSNEEFASQLRVLAFPFAKVEPGASVEIFHGAHGKYETRSPVRTFAVYNIGGEPNVLAAYTCTPLVKFPVSDLKSGTKVQGTTVAELGNRNKPLDMIVYQKDGKDYLLMANSSRGVMKVNVENIDKEAGITAKIANTAGLPYETIAELQGVVQLDKWGDAQALILTQEPATKVMTLRTIALP